MPQLTPWPALRLPVSRWSMLLVSQSYRAESRRVMETYYEYQVVWAEGATDKFTTKRDYALKIAKAMGGTVERRSVSEWEPLPAGAYLASHNEPYD